MLTPDIRTLGDIDDDDEGAGAFGAGSLTLPPALTPSRRRGALAKLIGQWRRAQEQDPLPPASLLAAADELAALLDQAALAGGVRWDRLKALAEELAPSLAEHWQVSASFLDIVMNAWPAYLAEQGLSDAQTRRLAAAEALKARWSATRPDYPVIIAGSTGTGAATRILMEAVLKLPRGIIVLPGLDPDLTPKGWAAVADAPSHPQHAIGATLACLSLSPADVRSWPDAQENPRETARRRLLNEALAPAAETRDWTKRLIELAAPDAPQELVLRALDGLCLIEAEDESEEALVAALLLRETLETPDKTVALVTPEAGLARRVAAILERWSLDIGPSSGLPLIRTDIGSFLILLSRWVRDPGDPVLLLAVLKHPFAGIAGDNAQILSQIERTSLRGPRRHSSLEDLADRLENPRPLLGEDTETGAKRLPRCAAFIGKIARLHQPAGAVFAEEALDGAKAAESIARLAEAIAGGAHIWSGKAGAQAARFINEIGELSADMGPIDAAHFADFAETLMQRTTCASEAPEHPRIAIWGPLEARLQRRDRIILASLNEGAWPRATPADAFLNRTLRRQIGLPDPDERIGLSAHDFAQMANAPEVILLRAKRVDDKPAVASRWLWRLRTLAAGGLGGREAAEAALEPRPGCDPLAWARALRHPEDLRPAPPPRPVPPVAARRLDSFSPSRVAKLIRDPYSDFASYILRLKPLRSVNEDIDARDRGTAIHLAVEIFEKGESNQTIDELIVESLKASGAAPELIELEKPLWARAGDAYLRWLRAREPLRAGVATEVTAGITFSSSLGQVRLEAKADRVEKLKDGSLAIIDFKTGKPKTASQVESGLEPQLALEAAIAAEASFGHVGPGRTSELIYFQMALSGETLKEKNGKPLAFENGATMDVAGNALDGLKSLIEQYADPAQPYYSIIRREFAWSESDYDRLARRAEWTVDEGGEE